MLFCSSLDRSLKQAKFQENLFFLFPADFDGYREGLLKFQNFQRTISKLKEFVKKFYMYLS